MSEQSAPCTIVTVDGVEVARTEALDSGRPLNRNPRLAIVHDESVPFTEVIAQEHTVGGVVEHRSVHEKLRLPNPSFVSPPSAPTGFGTGEDRWS